jgi:hypothetical protein
MRERGGHHGIWGVFKGALGRRNISRRENQSPKDTRRSGMTALPVHRFNAGRATVLGRRKLAYLG